MLVVFVYAATDFNSPEAKDEFYRELSRLLRSVHSTDNVVIAGGFNAKHDTSEDTFPFSADHTGHGDRFIRFRSYHRLFLANQFLS